MNSKHKNNFGLLRLAFAVLVIASHAPEMVDGNRSREPLTIIFGPGTISLGRLCVYGFFLVSGYLIVQSFEHSSSLRSYVWKRILRIYPAFIAASLFCLLVVGPFSGADVSEFDFSQLFRSVTRMIRLIPPQLPGEFHSEPAPAMNTPMWTIAYEFRCYIAVMLLGLLGIFKQRILLPFVALCSLSAGVFIQFDEQPQSIEILFGQPHDILMLGGVFLAGSCFYVFRKRISYRTNWAVCCAVLLVLSFLNYYAAIFSIPLFGGYLVFWFAFLENSPLLNRVNSTVDLSYGTYLYAWPLQNLAVRHIPGILPVEVFLIGALGAITLAVASWYLIEKPASKLKYA